MFQSRMQCKGPAGQSGGWWAQEISPGKPYLPPPCPVEPGPSHQVPLCLTIEPLSNFSSTFWDACVPEHVHVPAYVCAWACVHMGYPG